MRYVLILWAVPLTLFWSWYGLSANDINFGTFFFSRQVHDAVFQVYAQSIGTQPEAIPGMIAGACIFDTALIGAIAAFRWRKKWWPQTKAGLQRHFAALRVWLADLRMSRAPATVSVQMTSGHMAPSHMAIASKGEPYGPVHPGE